MVILQWKEFENIIICKDLHFNLMANYSCFSLHKSLDTSTMYRGMVLKSVALENFWKLVRNRICLFLTTNPRTNPRTRSPISGDISEPNCCNVVRKRFSLESCLAPQAGGSCCADTELPIEGGEGVRPFRLLCGEWEPFIAENNENVSKGLNWQNWYIHLGTWSSS